MQNTINRIKDYGILMRDIHQNKREYKCTDDELDWYKRLLRDNLNTEKQFQKKVEDNHKNYCKVK